MFFQDWQSWNYLFSRE